jgi:hydroxymethylpyrimidine pyrophosphatase-like HAD family hydrolase
MGNDLIDDLDRRLRARFGDHLFIAKSLPIFLEVASPGVSKGAALEFVCERLGVDPADTVAFGDGANDHELLETAGFGVAVEDAEPSLLRIADWTVPPVAEDGVAGFLDLLVHSRA